VSSQNPSKHHNSRVLKIVSTH